MPVLEKQPLSMEELDAMVAVELPDREMLSLITININNLLSNLSVKFTLSNVHLAITICGVVNVENLFVNTKLLCHISK
jgi:hypothetical protein